MFVRQKGAFRTYQRHLLHRSHDAGRARDRFGQRAGETARVEHGESRRRRSGGRRSLMVLLLALQVMIAGRGRTRRPVPVLLPLAVLTAGRRGGGGRTAEQRFRTTRSRPEIGGEQERTRPCTGRRRVEHRIVRTATATVFVIVVLVVVVIHVLFFLIVTGRVQVHAGSTGSELLTIAVLAVRNRQWPPTTNTFLHQARTNDFRPLLARPVPVRSSHRPGVAADDPPDGAVRSVADGERPCCPRRWGCVRCSAVVPAVDCPLVLLVLVLLVLLLLTLLAGRDGCGSGPVADEVAVSARLSTASSGSRVGDITPPITVPCSSFCALWMLLLLLLLVVVVDAVHADGGFEDTRTVSPSSARRLVLVVLVVVVADVSGP
uniref:Uncharacterized protein n=1 Tax=Anopheles farauti TaxID=69004 RepID=A0A182Q951_9DIPT